jgi:hypothetical protein
MSFQLAPSVWHLIDETADILERIGNITNHRNGASKLYAIHLKELLKQVAIRSQPVEQQSIWPLTMPQDTGEPHSAHQSNPSIDQPQPPAPAQWMESVHFSEMSDHEIFQTILDANQDFNAILPSVQHPSADFMWLDYMNPLEYGF